MAGRENRRNTRAEESDASFNTTAGQEISITHEITSQREKSLSNNVL